MNIRVLEEPTPEGRLAAIARDEMHRVLALRGGAGGSRLPDYADFREAMKRQVALEILQARIDEAKRTPGNDRRVRQLVGRLALEAL